jgi:uncharacterized protein YegJ (DUF2314 family)
MVLAVGLVAARWVWTQLRPTVLPEAPMVSLVLLLKGPRYLEPVVLAEVLRSAWGLNFEVSTGGEGEGESTKGKPYIVGNSPLFMVNTGDAVFVVHNHERLYFDDVPTLAEKIPDLRLRKLVLEHRAWLSVDALGVGDGAAISESYRRIAKALAELADDSVLALYQPDGGRLTPWEPIVEERLRKNENLAELFQLNQAPVVRISDDDPRMKAAVAEARQRWPEFVAAFKARRPGGNYAVKVPVTRGGNTEFIWLEVVGLEPEYIHGKLANDPVDLGELKLGDQVEVALSELNDWTFRHDESAEPAGLFSVRILADTFAQQSKRADGAR